MHYKALCTRPTANFAKCGLMSIILSKVRKNNISKRRTASSGFYVMTNILYVITYAGGKLFGIMTKTRQGCLFT